VKLIADLEILLQQQIVEHRKLLAFCDAQQTAMKKVDLKRMDEIRLARRSFLAPVVKRREKICPPYELDIRSRPVFFHLFDDVFDPYHFNSLILHTSDYKAYNFDVRTIKAKLKKCPAVTTGHLLEDNFLLFYLAALAFALSAASFSAVRASISV